MSTTGLHETTTAKNSFTILVEQSSTEQSSTPSTAEEMTYAQYVSAQRTRRNDHCEEENAHRIRSLIQWVTEAQYYSVVNETLEHDPVYGLVASIGRNIKTQKAYYDQAAIVSKAIEEVVAHVVQTPAFFKLELAIGRTQTHLPSSQPSSPTNPPSYSGP